MATLEESIQALKEEYETLDSLDKFKVYVYLSTLRYKQKQEQLAQK